MLSRLVIAATEAEISLLIEALNCRQQETILSFTVYHATRGGKDIFVVRSDPGIANAAAATAVAVDRFGPGKIFNVGVCGVYSDNMGLLAKVVAGTSAVFADAGVESDDSFLPLEAIDLPLAKTKSGTKVYNVIELNDKPVAEKVRRGIFLTVGASSGSNLRAQKIKSRFKIDEGMLLCEDMESAAVGLIALKASIPCTVLRGVSNLCGERDHKNWKLLKAAEAAQKELLKYL